MSPSTQSATFELDAKTIILSFFLAALWQARQTWSFSRPFGGRHLTPRSTHTLHVYTTISYPLAPNRTFVLEAKKINFVLFLCGSFVASAADLAVLEAVGSTAPDAQKHPHAARWHRHVSSFDAKARKSFAKAKKNDYVGKAAPAGKGKPAAAAAEEDEDVDLVSNFLRTFTQKGLHKIMCVALSEAQASSFPSVTCHE